MSYFFVTEKGMFKQEIYLKSFVCKMKLQYMLFSVNPYVSIVWQNSFEIFCHLPYGIDFVYMSNTTIINRVQVFQM